MEASPVSAHVRPGLRLKHGLLGMQPDATLCALAQRGHASAFAALHDRYHAKIYAFICHMLGGRGPVEDAEDLSQDVFTQAFRALPKRDRAVPFKPWIYKIARNRSIDFLRARRPAAADVADLELAAADSTEGSAERRAELAWLVEAVGELPERQRAALVLRELGGLSYREIAAALETTVPAVKLLLVRARERLAESGMDNGVRPRTVKRKIAAILPIAPLASAWPALAEQLGVGSVAGGAGAGVATAGAVKLAAVLAATGVVAGGAVGVRQGIEHGVASAKAERHQRHSGHEALAANAVAAPDPAVVAPARAGGGEGGDRRRARHDKGASGDAATDDPAAGDAGDEDSGDWSEDEGAWSDDGEEWSDDPEEYSDDGGDYGDDSGDWSDGGEDWSEDSGDPGY